jgi:hypothetical protein
LGVETSIGLGSPESRDPEPASPLGTTPRSSNPIDRPFRRDGAAGLLPSEGRRRNRGVAPRPAAGESLRGGSGSLTIRWFAKQRNTRIRMRRCAMEAARSSSDRIDGSAATWRTTQFHPRTWTFKGCISNPRRETTVRAGRAPPRSVARRAWGWGSRR